MKASSITERIHILYEDNVKYSCRTLGRSCALRVEVISSRRPGDFVGFAAAVVSLRMCRVLAL